MAGQVVAILTEGAHCPQPCMHWGLLAGETYLNPLGLLPARPPAASRSRSAVTLRR